MARIESMLPMIVLSAALLATGAAGAHGSRPHDVVAEPKPLNAEQVAWGIAGDAAKVTRTIRLDMSDEMKYHPAAIVVRKGDTIRFELRNNGGAMHEMVIGTKEKLAEHAELMREFPEMEHDEPYMAHVAPGKTGTIVWHFNRAGQFSFACLIPGHYEAGMVGTLVVR